MRLFMWCLVGQEIERRRLTTSLPKVSVNASSLQGHAGMILAMLELMQKTDVVSLPAVVAMLRCLELAAEASLPHVLSRAPGQCFVCNLLVMLENMP